MMSVSLLTKLALLATVAHGATLLRRAGPHGHGDIENWTLVRQRHTHTQTDRQADRQTHRHTDGEEQSIIHSLCLSVCVCQVTLFSLVIVLSLLFEYAHHQATHWLASHKSRHLLEVFNSLFKES